MEIKTKKIILAISIINLVLLFTVLYIKSSREVSIITPQLSLKANAAEQDFVQEATQETALECKGPEVEPAVVPQSEPEPEAYVEAERESYTPNDSYSSETRYVRVKAYCPCRRCINVRKFRDGKTSAGYYIKRGIVAVNPDFIPYGTKMNIPGYGYGVAGDTGSRVRRYNNAIEVFFNTHREARQWGVKWLEIKLY